ncbi:MAG: hypothetical protein M1837_002920 [Sclerophora amabilis]|nr:MAG: hypothetical protein M1837_002920 [Sclerophora amabilis]
MKNSVFATIAALLSLSVSSVHGDSHGEPHGDSHGEPPSDSQGNSFVVTSSRSGSPIHLQPVTASDTSLWIGKETSSYCPNPGAGCPAGNVTVLASSGGGASLSVLAPGGQLIYVCPTGALRYTAPHSASYPPGSTVTGFSYTPGSGAGGLGRFGFEGAGATGFIACPVTAGTAPWKLYANVKDLKDADVPSGKTADCLGFDALTTPFQQGAGAWQYT